ncbi:MAG: 3-hydroxy-D-aspartate aldolase [Algoriphagus sp.]|jgi:3-hydroxy-D-aspartate aldolase
MAWYSIQNIDTIDSPSLVLYENLVDKNLKQMIAMVNGETERLMPHVKTSKLSEVIKKMVALGIRHFKASTISEAEITAKANASSVLIAHQLVGPKIERLAQLILVYPACQFSTLVDNVESAILLNELAADNQINISVYIDINTGMDRSGIELGSGLNDLLVKLKESEHLKFRGLHAYDGHIHDTSFSTRKGKIDTGFNEVESLFADLYLKDDSLKLVSGGTPAFTSHLEHPNRICSPGTSVFWDWGYSEMLPEQSFDTAVLIITRVISKPTKGIITVDLGHKAVAAENPIHKRVKLLNLDNYELISQSEEHGVLKVENWDQIKVGDVFYGIPFHICPTINLHDEISVIADQSRIDTWQITARKRRINI